MEHGDVDFPKGRLDVLDEAQLLGSYLGLCTDEITQQFVRGLWLHRDSDEQFIEETRQYLQVLANRETARTEILGNYS